MAGLLWKADGSITLVKGSKNTFVDAGSPNDRAFIIGALELHGLTPADIAYVVCTHGHSDHVGNLNLFPGATFIVSVDISIGDSYIWHDFSMGAYEIDKGVEVIATPGHTGSDVSVKVNTEDYGVVVIAGDLFEMAEDLDDPNLWQAVSENQEVQAASRNYVLDIADHIVPGHGPKFEVPSWAKQ
ncbi:metallo-beta-lactamase domain-containing protein 1-like [Mya arenaria]|uniref:metallo-beta-lactamase domain-containing protein 1-like n=1 Tax=Mya arenaria TaxID=6604 RepID=UPI0022DEF614|nr:metallo-beta-lactamase domain-containing protein 1-like [Mya arenaria]